MGCLQSQLWNGVRKTESWYGLLSLRTLVWALRAQNFGMGFSKTKRWYGLYELKVVVWGLPAQHRWYGVLEVKTLEWALES